jgi:two-component system phosphate regulon sensor histidine kinase PhoR
MLLLDLKLLIFGFLLILIATVFLAIGLDRLLFRRRQSTSPPLESTAPLVPDQSTRFLLSDLSHELRTPLATLLTHLEVLRLPQISEETRQQSVHLMQKEAARMTRLVHNLLELGSLDSGVAIEQRPVNLHAVLDQVLAQVTSQAEEQRIGLSQEVDPAIPLVIGDADRLRQVFLNLLDNAIKYSRPGDRVTVSLNQNASRDGIVCAICDTGPGIPVEHLSKITRRFYRVASEEVGGSGLGLALVEEILRRHRSQLEIESRTEGDHTGTCVRFVLPTLPAEMDQ